MEWKKKYEHGIIWQDAQHEQLLEKIKVLLKMVVSGENDEKEFTRVVNFTIYYCNNHFKIEEKYMRTLWFL